MKDTGPGLAAGTARAAVRHASARSVAWTTAALIVCMAALLSLHRSPSPLFVWNASPSSPVGLYWVAAPKLPRVGDLVIAWPPNSVRRIAAARSYLPLRVPLVKRVAAVAGDRVCARNKTIYINARAAAVRRLHDPSGRPLPWWSSCARLDRGETFLLSQAGPLAFDGRYFGVTQHSDLIGKARLLWSR